MHGLYRVGATGEVYAVETKYQQLIFGRISIVLSSPSYEQGDAGLKMSG